MSVDPPDRRSRRRVRESKAATAWHHVPVRGQSAESSALHEMRLGAVLSVLVESGSTEVIDLGCGSGSLLLRLRGHDQFVRIVGVDASAEALGLARSRLDLDPRRPGRIELVHASLRDVSRSLGEFGAATLVETIEHLAPSELSRLERDLFERMRPGVVVVTTPNADYNVLYGMPAGAMRHADHRFEWGRERFGRWARGVGARTGYAVEIRAIGQVDGLHGSPTQLAVFHRSTSRGGLDAG